MIERRFDRRSKASDSGHKPAHTGYKGADSTYKPAHTGYKVADGGYNAPDTGFKEPVRKFVWRAKPEDRKR